MLEVQEFILVISNNFDQFLIQINYETQLIDKLIVWIVD